MKYIEWILDHTIWILAGVVGFFVGMFALLIAQLFAFPTIFVALAIVALFAALLLIDRLSDRLFFGGITKIAEILGADKEDVAKSKRKNKWHDRTSRLAFALGVVIAFLASQIMDPLNIMRLF